MLVVEDTPTDVYLIRQALTLHGIEAKLHIATDGEEAMRFLDAAFSDTGGPCPSPVILDLNLPKKNGIEVLRHLRRESRCRDAVVIVVSTSGSSRDHSEAMLAGANAYFRKPFGYEAFMKLGELVCRLWPNCSRDARISP
jgi:CheY-like chemotaxis protein